MLQTCSRTAAVRHLEEKDMIKVAVLGYGNIGSGVVAVLLNNKEEIAKQAGDEIVPVRVLDLRDFPGDAMEDKVVRDISLITGDPEISIVVETMGGTKPAYDFVKACLMAGKHVATSNKELVAVHGPELLKIAKEHGVNFLFEASVGGAIPIIRPLVSCVTADPVTEITGILNGTTNFMLTAMAEEGCAYEDILRKAQALGYAERNPSADVEGFDACRKIAILSSLAFGQWVDFNDIYTEGITKITDADMAYTRKMGMAIKLFGTSRRGADGVVAMVSPVMISRNHPLYSVNGVMNAVLVRGEMMGDLMFYGAGAGKLPTATAVVADVVSAVRHPHGGEIHPYAEGKLELVSAAKEKRVWFVRIDGELNQEALDAFGATEVVLVDGRKDFACLSAPMSEEELQPLLEAYPVLSHIRLAE